MKFLESTAAKLLVLGGVVLAIATAFFLAFPQREQVIAPENAVAQSEQPKDNQATSSISAQDDGKSIQVGGVRRPVTDLPVTDEVGNAKSEKLTAEQELERKIAKMDDYGKTTPVAFDTNAQTKIVSQSIIERRNPEQVSTLFPPKPFDLAAFKANPQAYVDTIEPGRVFQVAQPGPDVQAIGKISPHYQEVKQGESVYLQVSAPEGMPVTFTSLDLGRFENDLTSITVLADSEGVAQASFTGSSGTINDVHIVAGSPVTSGTAKFVVHVTK